MLLSSLRFAVVLLVLAAAPRLAHAVDLGEPAIGDPKAPVTIIEFASLTCPHCASFHVNTLPELEKRYIDTGKVRLVLRDFPLDEVALKAAVIAHCAGPDRYPQFVQVFFAQQAVWVPTRSTPALPTSRSRTRSCRPAWTASRSTTSNRRPRSSSTARPTRATRASRSSWS